jgi:hypothetical protein
MRKHFLLVLIALAAVCSLALASGTSPASGAVGAAR